MTEDQDRPTPTPAANAARRARRIGGRPSPSPGPEAPAKDTAVRLDKPAAPVDTVATPSARPTAGPGRAKTARSLALAWFPAAVLGTAAVLLLGILVWFSHGGYWAKPPATSVVTPTATEQEKVLAAAKTCFAKINTYDYRTLDASLAAGLKCTTGSFTNDYRTAFVQQIEKYAPTVKAVQSAQVNKAGVASISPDGKQWVVLIFGQLQTDNVSTQKDGSPRISPVGGVFTMDDVDGTWLVSKVDTDAGTGLGG